MIVPLPNDDDCYDAMRCRIGSSLTDPTCTAHTYTQKATTTKPFHKRITCNAIRADKRTNTAAYTATAAAAAGASSLLLECSLTQVHIIIEQIKFQTNSNKTCTNFCLHGKWSVRSFAVVETKKYTNGDKHKHIHIEWDRESERIYNKIYSGTTAKKKIQHKSSCSNQCSMLFVSYYCVPSAIVYIVYSYCRESTPWWFPLIPALPFYPTTCHLNKQYL